MSPKRAVHVRSPLKYENGRLVPVVEHNNKPPVTMPATACKAVSSFNVVEGSPERKGANSVALGELNRPQNITESNFFKAGDHEKGLDDPSTKGSRSKIGANLPNIMQKLLDQTQGSFQGTDHYI